MVIPIQYLLENAEKQIVHALKLACRKTCELSLLTMYQIQQGC